MNVKNIFCLLLALVTAMALPLSAMAETDVEEEFYQMEGFVTEPVDGGFLLEDKNLGAVICNMSDATILEGVVAEEGVQAGQYLIVDYSGRLTRSIPPQAHADRVTSYQLHGQVLEILDEHTLAVNTETNGEVWVYVEEMPAAIVPGMNVTVYYDGIMALSLPPQVAARALEIAEMTGTVTQMTETGFMLNVNEDLTVEIAVDGLTHFSRLTETEVTEGEETLTVTGEEVLFAPEVEAEEEVPAEEILDQPASMPEEESAEASEEELAEAALAEEATADEGPAVNRAPEYLTEGDLVTVYYRGQMEDLPLEAVKVVILP